MLVEKYRPKKLSEIIGQPEVVKRLQELVNKGTYPHLLFHGPPGCGKTSAAYAFASEVNIPIVELNASDDRGINVVREKIKSIAFTASRKILLLDEADSMTSDAQHALRRTMEKSRYTVFILTCNELYKIIDALKSRCSIFEFRRLSDVDVASVLLKIIKHESVEVKSLEDVKEVVKIIVKYVNGDLRKAINILETSITSTRSVTYEGIKSLIAPNIVTVMLSKAVEGKWDEAFSLLSEVRDNVEPFQSISLLYDAVSNLNVPIHVKLRLFDKLADVERNLKIGCNPKVQLTSFLATACAMVVSIEYDKSK